MDLITTMAIVQVLTWLMVLRMLYFQVQTHNYLEHLESHICPDYHDEESDARRVEHMVIGTGDGRMIDLPNALEVDIDGINGLFIPSIESIAKLMDEEETDNRQEIEDWDNS